QLVLGAQDGVDDVAVAGQQDQAPGILVQPPDREDPLLVADEIDDVARYRRLGGAGDADRLVQGDVDMPALALGGAAHPQRLAVDPDLIVLADLGADARAHAVDRDPALADQPVGLAPRAETGVADVLVQSHPDRDVGGGRAVSQIGGGAARAACRRPPPRPGPGA